MIAWAAPCLYVLHLPSCSVTCGCGCGRLSPEWTNSDLAARPGPLNTPANSSQRYRPLFACSVTLAWRVFQRPSGWHCGAASLALASRPPTQALCLSWRRSCMQPSQALPYLQNKSRRPFDFYATFFHPACSRAQQLDHVQLKARAPSCWSFTLKGYNDPRSVRAYVARIPLMNPPGNCKSVLPDGFYFLPRAPRSVLLLLLTTIGRQIYKNDT